MAESPTPDLPRIGSLFSGIGGLELGLEWAGVGETVWNRKQVFRAALAEAGYPNAEVSGTTDDDIGVLLGDAPGAVPDDVCWRAHAVSGAENLACWPCWSANMECSHDWRIEPWPGVSK